MDKETSTVQIRPMTLADIEQVHAIDELSFSVPWPLNSYRFEVRDNLASLCWVAEEQLPDGSSKIVGMIVVWMILGEAHIATIATHPEYRRQGIARSLLVTALKEAVRRKALEATLEVRIGNLSAQSLYRSYGFEVVGLRRKYYQDNNEDALIMTVSNLDQEYLDRLDSMNGGAA